MITKRPSEENVRAFSLVELLVVVAILALLPAPAGAGQPTHQVKLKDGTVIRGSIMAQMDDAIMINTADGIRKIETKKIEKMTKIVASPTAQQPNAEDRSQSVATPTHVIHMKDGSRIEAQLLARTDREIMLRMPDGKTKKVAAELVEKVTTVAPQGPPGSAAPAADAPAEPLDPLVVLDTIKLADGETLKGKVVLKTDSLVMLRTPEGGVRKLARSDIADMRVLTREDLQREYAGKKAAAPGEDYGRNIELARWCYANKLHQEGNAELKAVSKSSDRTKLLGAIRLAIEENDLTLAGSLASAGSGKFPDDEAFKRIESNAKSLFDLRAEKKQLVRQRIFAARDAAKAKADVERLRAKVADPYQIYYENVKELIKCPMCGGTGRTTKPPPGRKAFTIKDRTKKKKKKDEPETYPCPKCDGGRKKKYVTRRVEKKRKIDVTKEQERLAELEPELREKEKKLKDIEDRLEKVKKSMADATKVLAAEIEP